MAKHKRQRQKGGRAEPESRVAPSAQSLAQSRGLTFSPFAGLAPLVAKLPAAAPSSDDLIAAQQESFTASAAQSQKAAKPAESAPQAISLRAPLTLRTESKGRHGKVVTRIIGIDVLHLKQLGVQMQKAFGCGSVVEGQDLVLLGAVEARAAAWLRNAGATRVRAAGEREQTGHQRQAIQPGQRVAIVLKADQRSGNLTEGIVEKLLTRSPTHPHGIKVRLVSGLVGRVKKVLDP